MARRVGFPSVLGAVQAEELWFDPQWTVPRDWLPRGRWAGQGVAMHTFCDDYRQEFFWRRPEEGLLVALTAAVCTAPDFTVWNDDPQEWRDYQAWRSATVAAFWQRHGVEVVPVVSFGSRCEKWVQAGSAWAIRGPSSRGDRLKAWCDDLARWEAFAFPGALVVFGNPIPEGVVSCSVVQRALFSRTCLINHAAQKEGRGDGRQG